MIDNNHINDKPVDTLNKEILGISIKKWFVYIITGFVFTSLVLAAGIPYFTKASSTDITTQSDLNSIYNNLNKTLIDSVNLLAIMIAFSGILRVIYMIFGSDIDDRPHNKITPPENINKSIKKSKKILLEDNK